jgi:murein DD-endopeptidase MepM/ murein hydrolase activator NlpD
MVHTLPNLQEMETMYELGTTNYNENASLDVDKEKNGIQMKELITEYYTSLHNGNYARNTWRNPLDKMELRGWYNTWRPEDSNHGIVPTRNKGKHDGLDLYAPVGTPVFACVDGIRVRIGPDISDTYGKTITIRGYYNGKEYHFFYAHLSETYIKIGEKVKAGKKIGVTGKTGNAKDLLAKQTHLHFEVRKSNAIQGASIHPLETISEIKDSVTLNPDKEKQK